MTLTELVLWTALTFLFCGKNLQKRLPGIGLISDAAYDFSSCVSAAALHPVSALGPAVVRGLLLYLLGRLHRQHRFALLYYAGGLPLGAGRFLRSHALRCRDLPLAAVASVIICLSTISLARIDIMLLPAFAYKLMNAVSIIELCLLAFLCISMNALRLSVRDLSFGIALGFGVLSSSDFILSAVLSAIAR